MSVLRLPNAFFVKEVEIIFGNRSGHDRLLAIEPGLNTPDIGFANHCMGCNEQCKCRAPIGPKPLQSAFLRAQELPAQLDLFGKMLWVVDEIDKSVSVVDLDLQDSQQLEAQDARYLGARRFADC